MKVEEIGRYDHYTDTFLKNTTIGRIKVGTDGNLYISSVSNSNEYLSKDRLYTKSDIVAMLTEILTDFDNLIEPNSTRIDCESIVEQKIQKLEGKSDGEK